MIETILVSIRAIHVYCQTKYMYDDAFLMASSIEEWLIRIFKEMGASKNTLLSQHRSIHTN